MTGPRVIPAEAKAVSSQRWGYADRGRRCLGVCHDRVADSVMEVNYRLCGVFALGLSIDDEPGAEEPTARCECAGDCVR